jgi:phosphoglycerate dehydrogenase-like enzyme
MSGASDHTLAPQRPADTKLVICGFIKFTLWRPPAELAERVRQRWPEMRVVHLPHHDQLAPELPDTDIFVGYVLRPEQLRLARRLKWLHTVSAGVAQLMYPELRDSGIVVTNASGVHAIPMAEHVIGMILALLRDLPGSVRYQLQHRWTQQEIWDGSARPRELHGQTAVLVGFGAVGRAVAERLRAMGVHVWAVTRSGQADPALAERAFPVAQLDSALAGADIVVLAAPDTPETRRMIGAPQLALLKPSAILINVARGSLVDEPALVAALQSRAIAAAGLDVASQEPLPPESPLWSLDNVLITPHTSGVTERLWEREAELLIDNLERWFSGKPLRNLVDLSRGY